MAKAKETNGWAWFLVAILILVVLGGIVWWVKPGEYLARWADEEKQERATSLARTLADYYAAHKQFPWNFASKDYVPTGNLRRSEAAFVYLPAVIAIARNEVVVNRDWWWSLLEIIGAEREEMRFWRENDDYFILKQVSAGSRVAVCFQPASQKYQAAASLDCKEDGWHRRDGQKAVAGFDPCVDTTGAIAIGNLWCAIEQ